MNEHEAKERVIRAGMELVKSGLIARTWGNVSCRVDESTFAITPSGRSYETLKPDEIVLCRIEDTSYEGDIKPSSEKGIHALVYQVHPNINFVIHTHQPRASVISSGKIQQMPALGYSLLGEGVPIAKYGLPGTKKLKEGVGYALRNCSSHAIFMAHHGVLCYGVDYDETFEVAQQLEDASLVYVRNLYLKASGADTYEERELYNFYVSMVQGKSVELSEPMLLFNSRRTPDGFILESKSEIHYRFTDENLPEKALIHSLIYQKRKDISFIHQTLDKGVFQVSLTKIALRPLLDDFAQIIGISSRSAKGISPKQIVRALRRRSGVLVPGGGALCCAASKSDAHAAQLVMEKGALAQIGTYFLGGGKAINLFECLLMHFVYTKSYAKKAKSASAQA